MTNDFVSAFFSMAREEEKLWNEVVVAIKKYVEATGSIPFVSSKDGYTYDIQVDKMRAEDCGEFPIDLNVGEIVQRGKIQEVHVVNEYVLGMFFNTVFSTREEAEKYVQLWHDECIRVGDSPIPMQIWTERISDSAEKEFNC